jgi:hypothetical protein
LKVNKNNEILENQPIVSHPGKVGIF